MFLFLCAPPGRGCRSFCPVVPLCSTFPDEAKPNSARCNNHLFLSTTNCQKPSPRAFIAAARPSLAPSPPHLPTHKNIPNSNKVCPNTLLSYLCRYLYIFHMQVRAAILTSVLPVPYLLLICPFFSIFTHGTNYPIWAPRNQPRSHRHTAYAKHRAPCATTLWRRRRRRR